MTLVSDVKLATAVFRAGALPSISASVFYKNGTLDISLFDNGIKRFTAATGSSNVLVNIDRNELITETVTDIIIDNKIRFIELFNTPMDEGTEQILASHISFLKKNHNITVIFKALKDPHKLNQGTIILKGPDGAGRTNNASGSLDNNFDRIKNLYPTMNIIPSGGITKCEDVKHFMDKGSLAIGIGTLLAMSEESLIAHETKIKLLEATANDVNTFGNLNIQGVKLGDISNDSDNYTRSLYKGIRSANAGAIFVGKGIDKITQIKPVNDIIQELVKDEY
jgi:NAD(P)H-dependent flavin oxidoreductase YrpB (nitropropane dioxygenase family)